MELIHPGVCVVLDIEGTTTPMTFHLTATFDTQKTKDDIKLLRAQVEDDLEQGSVVGALPIAPDEACNEGEIDSLVANVEAI
ncbi:hypothetical protein MKW94_010415 [Papaver nudicaule]|uniref:Uncharacterized protein n=1 Tax=Papaver nudicaule TaxID=74823 RepID=A0AA41VES7_PAPNU|nr:hypothetical protein [Papaver nudicaule]